MGRLYDKIVGDFVYGAFAVVLFIPLVALLACLLAADALAACPRRLPFRRTMWEFVRDYRKMCDGDS